MKHFIMIMLLLCVMAGEAISQKYSTTLGVRVSKYAYGVALKQRVLKSFALEGIVAGGGQEVSGTLLLEKHFPLIGKGLSAYVGGGAHIGMLQDFGPTMGADALIGAELKLPFLPLVVSADVKPAYQVVHEEWFDFNSAVTVRYVIGKDTQKQREKNREKKKRKKERKKAKKERLKEKAKKQKQKEKRREGRHAEEKKLFQDVHLLKIFQKTEDERSNSKRKD